MPKRVMVFNDDRDILDMFALMLETEGYIPFTHLSPQIDESEVERVAPDLIILDWLYGYRDRGLELLYQLRAFTQTATTPIIVCTASGEPHMGRYATILREEQADLMYKPFDLHALTELIATRLNRASD